jgi:hypothetical protein
VATRDRRLGCADRLPVIAGRLIRGCAAHPSGVDGALFLFEELVAVPADSRGFAAGLLEFAADVPATASGPPGTGEQQAQSAKTHRADHDARKKLHAGRASDVITEDAEVTAERVRATTVGQHTGKPEDHRRDKDD